MATPSTDPLVSQNWTHLKLAASKTREEAAAYFDDYWTGWIARPMLTHLAHGEWAQLCLASIAVEALAYHSDTLAALALRQWDGRSVLKRKGELSIRGLYCSQFVLIFAGCNCPSGLSLNELAEITYGSVRCGLAHRSMTTTSNRQNQKWVTVIEGQADIFQDGGVRNSGVRRLIIHPEQFAKQVNAWAIQNVVEALRSGASASADAAFKEWCTERWEIPAANWKF